MRHLAIVAALCAASAVHGATDLKLGLAQGLSAIQTPDRSNLGVAGAFDLQAERDSPGRVLTFGLSGEFDAEGDASGAAALSFADRSGGRITAFGLSHERLDDGGFDPLSLLSAPRSTTRGEFTFGRAVGGATDWAVSGAFFSEGSQDGDATGSSLTAEVGTVPGPARRVALQFGQDRRSLSGAEAVYADLGVAVQAGRPNGRDQARLNARTTPDGVRLETSIATTRQMPRGGVLSLQLGVSKTAEGDVVPITNLDLRLGLTRQSRIEIQASHRVIDDPLRGEIGDLRASLSAHHRPTRLTLLEFGLEAFRRDPLVGRDGDSGTRASMRLSRELTRDWSLSAELEHRRLDAERSPATRRSQLSIMLERRFDGRGF